MMLSLPERNPKVNVQGFDPSFLAFLLLPTAAIE